MSIAGSSIPRLHIHDDDDDSSLDSEEAEQERLLSAKFGEAEATSLSSKRKKSAEELAAEEAKDLLKKKRKPRPKLTGSILKGGLVKIRREFPKSVKFRGRGDEARFARNMICKVKEFCFDIFPHAAFEDVLDDIEKLGSSDRVVKDYMNEMRNDVRREFLIGRFGKERAQIMLTEVEGNVMGLLSPKTMSTTRANSIPMFTDGDADFEQVEAAREVNAVFAAESNATMTSPTSIIQNPYNKGGGTQQSRLSSSPVRTTQDYDDDGEAEFEPTSNVMASPIQRSTQGQDVTNNDVQLSEVETNKNTSESRVRRTIESSDDEDEAEFDDADDDLEIVGRPSENAGSDNGDDDESLFAPVLSNKKELASQESGSNQSIVNDNTESSAQGDKQVGSVASVSNIHKDDNDESDDDAATQAFQDDDDDATRSSFDDNTTQVFDKSENDRNSENQESITELNNISKALGAQSSNDVTKELVVDATQISQTQDHEEDEPNQSMDY